MTGARSSADFYARLLSAGEEESPTFGSPDNDAVAAIFQHITENVVRYLDHSLQDDETAALLRAGQVSICTVPQARVQAATMRVGAMYAIAVNRGLALFLYRLARVFARHVITRGPDDPPAPPESDSVDIIASILDWMASPVHAPLMAEDWPVSDRERRTAENFTTAAERFVVCHEIAHVLLGHFVAASGNIDRGVATVDDVDMRAAAEEVAADVTGAVLAIDSMNEERIDPRAAVVGMHFFLQVLDTAEQLDAVLVDDSHPPAIDRLAACHAGITARYGDDAPVLLSWALDTHDLLGRILEQSDVLRHQRRAEAAAQIERVFAETPWRVAGRDLAADYELMQTVMALLARAPSAVIEAMQANLLDAATYTERVRVAGSPEELEHDDVWRRHQIAHFLARHAPQQVQDVLGVQAL